MKTQKTRLLAASGACLILGMAIGGGTAMAYQGHMWNALHDLQAAQNQLQLALADKGGHRANAMGLISQAISEVNAGISAGAE